MAVYILGIEGISDQEAFKADYLPESRKLMEEAGAKVVVRCWSPPNNITVLEGDPLGEGTKPNNVALLEFPSMEALRSWYDAPAYGELKALRQRLSKAVVLILETVPA